MAEIVKDFHKEVDELDGEKVLRAEDYSVDLNKLPKSDVIIYFTGIGSIVDRAFGDGAKNQNIY